jgi:predicted phage tail protein
MNRHPFDPLSFVLGALFVVVAWSFLPGTRSVADLSPAWSWILPLLGVSLLVVLSGLRRALARPEEPARSDAGEDAPASGRSPSPAPKG